jgi:hypothetical protein
MFAGRTVRGAEWHGTLDGPSSRLPNFVRPAENFVRPAENSRPAPTPGGRFFFLPLYTTPRTLRLYLTDFLVISVLQSTGNCGPRPARPSRLSLRRFLVRPAKNQPGRPSRATQLAIGHEHVPTVQHWQFKIFVREKKKKECIVATGVQLC